MPDRIIRDELLDSERWIDLPSDTDRLCYLSLLLICDDFGNLEAGTKRLFRFFVRFAQVKSPENTATILQHLVDADLIRGYNGQERAFFHLPRFRPHRQYLVRKYPQSPWDTERKIGKNRRVISRGLAKNQDDSENVVDISQTHSMHMSEGVGVGVGVGVNQKRSSAGEPVDNFSRESAQSWSEHWTAKGKAFGIEPLNGESTGDYCRRVQAFAKLKSGK